MVAIYSSDARGVSLKNLKQFETTLRRRYPEWLTKIIPPFQALPFIYYEVGSDQLTQPEKEKLTEIIWALQRWDTQEVVIIGFASTIGEFEHFNNKTLAARRANRVVATMQASGIKAQSRAEYRSFKQHQEEPYYGYNYYQRVEVRILKPIGQEK